YLAVYECENEDILPTLQPGEAMHPEARAELDRWLAYGALRNPVGAITTKKSDPTRAFRQGLLVNLTNPKIILFVLAFIPQFVDPARGPIMTQFLLFGLILSAGGLLVNGAVGVFAGSLGHGLAKSPGFGKTISYVSASIFVAIAARLALAERS
ncbi:MAG: LysE family translocator, partial [Paracoccaceae bacterium]